MALNLLKLNIDVTDDDIDDMFPPKISRLARKHWTPVAVAKLATEFLVDRPGTRVLDIGSGAGKFCLIGAACTQGLFTGVEQRIELVELSRQLSLAYQVYNAKFIHGNITSISFDHYDSFYFYNSFYEHITALNRIDETIQFNISLYHQYSMYLLDQLDALPPGTRLVTYYGEQNIIPSSFKLLDSLKEDTLKFWEKRKNSL